ncbi:hypothetical protein KAU32_01135, partial [bacterium]|nr:hypothetical protein [bacterium]
MPKISANNLPYNRKAVYYNSSWHEFTWNEDDPFRARHIGVRDDFQTFLGELGYEYEELLRDKNVPGDPNLSDSRVFRIDKFVKAINSPTTGILLLEGHGLANPAQFNVAKYYCTEEQIETYVAALHERYNCGNDEVFYSMITDDVPGYDDYQEYWIEVTPKFIKNNTYAMGRNSIVIGGICYGAVLKDGLLSNTKISNYFASLGEVSAQDGDLEMFLRNVIRFLTGQNEMYVYDEVGNFIGQTENIRGINFTCKKAGTRLNALNPNYFLYSNPLIETAPFQTVYNAPK